MRLPYDYCRCHGAYDQRTCDRTEHCARHLALRSDPEHAYISQAALLCYSGYTFFIPAPGAEAQP